jgi:DHA2 family multidrug resistance protein-like MFS transporter
MLGSLGTVIYRTVMDGVDLGSLDPVQVGSVLTALAGAVEAAKLLGSDPPDWLETARSGLSLGFAASSVLASVTLLFTAMVVRGIYARADPDMRGCVQ